MSSDGAEITSHEWRQGSFGTCDDFLNEMTAWPDTARLVVAVSHDCDLVNSDIAKEPYAELLVAHRASGPVGDFTLGKNPRMLALTMNAEDYTVSVHDRLVIDRALLARVTPLGRLPHEQVKILGRWMGQRYVRAAFPDAFNSRLASSRRNLIKTAASSSEYLSGIYFLVSDVELPDGESYELTVVASMRVDDYADSSKREQSELQIVRLAALLNDCVGVEVEDFEVRPENLLSLDDLLHLKRWDVDHLSYRDGPEAPLTPIGA